MRRFIKTLLIWLVVAALPVQGFAATVQFACATSHRTTSQIPAHSERHHHEAHPLAQDHVPSHAHHPNSHLQSSQSDLDSNTGCSACAACCIGAAITSSLPPSLPQAVPSAAVLIPPPDLLPAYVPRNLDRPPKHVSA